MFTYVYKFTYVYFCLLVFSNVYHCLLVFVCLCLSVFLSLLVLTYSYPILLVLSRIFYVYNFFLVCLPVFIHVYSLLPVYSCLRVDPVYSCVIFWHRLLVFTYVYLCLPMFTLGDLCLHLVTYVYAFLLELPMFTCVYVWFLVFTYVDLFTHVYLW